MSRKRPITDFPRNEPGLVDNFLGTSYDVVKDVYLNLDSVVKVSEEIDTLPESAKQIFEESVELYMPNVEKNMDKYVESKKPEIDAYIETSKVDITNHTNSQKAVVDKAIQDASVDMSNQLEEGKVAIQAISDEASTHANSAKESARLAKLSETGSKQSADTSKLHSDNAKKEVDKSEAYAKQSEGFANQSETVLSKTLASEASAKKHSDAAEIYKDTASSFAASADYSQKEAYRSELDIKNRQGEINLKSLEVERNTKLTSENRDATLKYRDESEGFRDQSLVSKNEAEYWANKALENSGMDTTAFVGKSDIVGIKGNHTTRIIHQKAVTEFLNEKRDHKDTDFVEVTVDGFLIKKTDTSLTITKDEETLTLPNKGTLITEDTVNNHLTPINKTIEELENSKQDKLTFTGEGDVLTKDIIIDSLDDSNNLPTSKAVKMVTDQFIPKTDIAIDLGDSNDLPISQLAVKSAIEEVVGSVYSKSNSYSSSEIDTKLLTKVDKTSISIDSLGDTDSKVPSEKLVKTSIANHHDATKINTSSITQSFGNSLTLVGSQALITGLNNQITSLNSTTNSLKTGKWDIQPTVGSGNITRLSEVESKLPRGIILGNTNLNSLGADNAEGIYYQTANSNATTANNYPVNTAGTLFVTRSAYGCQQMYVSFSSGKIYVRGLSGAYNGNDGPWYPWKTVALTSDIPSLNGYATQAWTNSQGFLKSANLNGYATQTWVNGRGFITSAQAGTKVRYAEVAVNNSSTARNPFGAGNIAWGYGLQSRSGGVVPITLIRLDGIINLEGAIDGVLRLWTIH